LAQIPRLVLNPKANPEKATQLAFAIEAGIMHLFWRTSLIELRHQTMVS
jgi:hypothetical protein